MAPVEGDTQDLLDALSALESEGVNLLWRLAERLPLHAGFACEGVVAALFGGSEDLVAIDLPPFGPCAARGLFLSTLTRPEVVNQSLVGGLAPRHPAGKIAEVHGVTTYGDAVGQILSGRVLLLVDGTPGALAVEARGYPTRGISRPEVESVVRGPHEAFIEDVEVNISLLRRRLRDPRLAFEPLTLGRLSKTPVRLCYIRGLTNRGLVAEARRRLRDVSAPAIGDSEKIQEFIEDDPYSLFPQVLFTERPDVVAASLAEGRFAILVDGTSNALIAPVTLWSMLQTPEDYTSRFWVASFLRLLRILNLATAMTAPAVYIALTAFHQQMVPEPLLFTIMHARHGIPFPAVVEAFLLEIAFEILREASLRLPQKLGTSLGVVGALIIGQAAVFAGLVSWPMVVVIAITAIANFALPRWELALMVRLVRFVEMLAAALFGLPGMVTVTAGVIVHLVSLRSFGVPYLFPVAPLDLTGLQDVLARMPHWVPRRRPRLLAPGWRLRVRPGRRPAPPAHPGTIGWDPW